PDVRRNTEIPLQQLRARDHLPQYRAAAHELHFQAILAGLALFFPVAVRGGQKVHAAEYSVLGALGQRRMRVVLVHYGEVIIDVFLLPVHAAQAVLDDDRDLVREGRIVRHAVRNGRGNEQAVAVFVLQPFAVERRSPGGAAQQKAPRAHVAGGPREIADALEAEHRLENEERDHRIALRRVRRGRGDPRAHSARFTDAFL